MSCEKDFFGFALQLERNSVELYTKMQELFEHGSDDHRMFGNLVGEEKKHMLFILNKLYEME